MKYKVLIKKCEDPGRVNRIAEEVAKWSGSTADVVQTVITQKAICIRKEADEAEAFKLKAQFEAVGAQIELVKIEPSPVKANATNEDDDEDGAAVRTLSDKEFSEVCKARGDMFIIDNNSRLRNLLVLSLAFGVVFGFWISTREIVKVATDFFEKIPEERTARFVKEVANTPLDEKKKEEEKEKIKTETEQKKLKPNKYKGQGGTTGGGGDPRARVTQKGVLGLISGKITGKSVASADIFGKGGFASNIDGILQGVGGLKSGGSGGVGRRGAAGIGFGSGYGSGFGGGSASGGIDDLIGGLVSSVDVGGKDMNLKKRGSLAISAPTFTKGGALTGGRSRESIMRVVMQNLAALRYAYNKRLREKPGLKGKIMVKFAIDEFGKVMFCQVMESTMDDSELETTVVEKIKRWVFDKIDKPGDVTEVIYPFVFSQ